MAIVISGTLNDITVNGSSVVTEIEAASPSTPAPYHIYNGQVSLTNSVTTTGFSTTLYTGNGTSQSVTTGVDMDTQWGNDASERFGGLVWIKGRSVAYNNFLTDSINVDKYLISNSTAIQATADVLDFTSSGVLLKTGGTSSLTNENLATYASWNFQTTHRVSGTTNHGKAFTCHYNPFTGFTIVKYEGSGIAGHEIPHYLGRKLGFVATKNLSSAVDWWASRADGQVLKLNLTDAEAPTGIAFSSLGDTNTVLDTGNGVNASTNQYIMYGWTNSYFDEKSTLIGNYDIGVYQGTGVAGNKINIRGKPAWVMIKRLDTTANWLLQDNIRGDKDLYANLSNAETSVDLTDFVQDGFVLKSTIGDCNASGGQYLYMVVYDNDSGSGKSKYPRATDTSTLNLNAHVPFANGIDTTGNKVSIAYKNETLTLSNSLVQGKNYIALLNDGSYVATTAKPSYGLINPASGDFFNIDTQKWYSNLNVEITPRNYLDCIVYADQNGQPEYVEQIEKVQYFDAVKANDFRGKNACTAWVVFDGTTTPPTIKDSYNISSIVRLSTGKFRCYFGLDMDNNNFSFEVSSRFISTATGASNEIQQPNLKYLEVVHYENSAAANTDLISIQVFGGKN